MPPRRRASAPPPTATVRSCCAANAPPGEAARPSKGPGHWRRLHAQTAKRARQIGGTSQLPGSSSMSQFGTLKSPPWYRSLDRAQWKALIASNLGWTFDGFEVFSLILTVGVALHQLLDPSEYARIPAYAGAVIAITVFGWAIG